MGTKSIFFLLTAAGILFAGAAVADEMSGRTADGCTYKVINGQYLTSCPNRGRPAPVATTAPSPNSSYAARPAPVTDYGAVPVRRNSAASAPSLPPMQHNGSSNVVSSIERESSVRDADDFDGERRQHLRNNLLDQTYVGLVLGASNMKESNAGSSTGFGLDIGTNIDDTFGVELGYTYARQDLNLGLASRGSSVDTSQSNNGYMNPVRSADSTLSSNLFTIEGQAHLTDPVKRLRPYLGAGFGWRSATLTENADQYGALAGSSLHQSALGGLATAGTKLRLGKNVNLGFAFRYFLPLARQDARLEQPVAASSYGAQAPSQSHLSASDDLLTGSSQYQILGGVQYAF